MTLARLLCPLEPVDPQAIVTGSPTEGARWLKAADWRVLADLREPSEGGEVIETFELPDGRSVPATVVADQGAVAVPFDPDEAYRNLVSERWREGTRVRELGSGKLAVYYRVKRLIPRGAQLRARRMLARWQGTPEFPAWPLERSVHELLRFYVKCVLRGSGRASLPFRWFWPDAKAAALILTHDVESAEGLRLAPELADLEEELGLRSSFNVVGDWYPIDMGIVDELRSRGFEIGSHGVYHDRSMFSSRAMFDEQQPALRDAIERFGAVGFRSPATHRVFEWLGELPVEYDCSIPHSDPYEPQPGGCCSVWPFFIDEVVELPYTLPQDHTLFTVLGRRDIDVWLEQVERLVEANGLIQCLTHPDPGYTGDRDKRAYYAEFLAAMRDRDDLWHALPREIAGWWRQRDTGAEGPWPLVRGRAILRDNLVAFEPDASLPIAS